MVSTSWKAANASSFGPRRSVPAHSQPLRGRRAAGSAAGEAARGCGHGFTPCVGEGNRTMKIFGKQSVVAAASRPCWSGCFRVFGLPGNIREYHWRGQMHRFCRYAVPSESADSAGRRQRTIEFAKVSRDRDRTEAKSGYLSPKFPSRRGWGPRLAQEARLGSSTIGWRVAAEGDDAIASEVERAVCWARWTGDRKRNRPSSISCAGRPKISAR